MEVTMRRWTRPLLPALVAFLGAGGAPAEPLPVDALYCNVACEGPAPTDACSMGLIGGLSIDAERSEILPLESNDGVEVTGELAIPTGDGQGIPLAQAALVLRFSQPDPNACLVGFDILRGEALLPVPGGGALRSASIEVIEQPMASVGLDLGKHLIPSESPWCLPEFGIECTCEEFCLDSVPVLRTDAHYLFFDVDAKYTFSVAGFPLPSSPGVAATFVLDPSDPYFFLTGSAMGIPGLKTPLNASSGGFGFSWNDEIPFVPLSTYPFGDVMKPFRGGYAGELALPIFETEAEQVKVLLDGQLIVSLDPDEDDDHPFLTPDAFLADPDLALGANGEFSVRFSPFKKKEQQSTKKSKKPKKEKPVTDKSVQKEGKKAKKKGLANTLLSMTFDVGVGSAIGRVHPAGGDLYLSGVIGDEQSLLPSWMPIPVSAGAGTKMAAFFSTDVEESFVQAEGSMGLDTTVLARWAKMEEVGTVLGVDGFLRADASGFEVGGGTHAQMHPEITPSGAAGVEAKIASNGVDSFITLRGAVTIAGEGFPNAAVTFSPSGVDVEATLAFVKHEIDMTGSFKGSKGRLEGSTQVEIPYERDDTVRKLQLLDEILNQSELVAAGELTLADTEATLEQHRRNADAVAADLAAAIAEVERLQDEIDALDAQILQKQLALIDQRDRDCNADYSSCRSCSSCSSRCDCGRFDVVCHADCTACQTARGICLGEREACRLANVAPCELDRAAKIAALGAEVAALETAKAGVVAAKDVALGVLEPLRAANELAQTALRSAEKAFETALASLNAAQAGLAALQDQLDNLPAIEGMVAADLTLRIDTSPKGDRKVGRVTGTFEGRKVGKGRIDLEAEPPIVCVTVPLRELGEICSVL
jgi:hypothetical protein